MVSEEVLLSFCAKGGNRRPELCNPVSNEKHVYFSDSHIAVRVDKTKKSETSKLADLLCGSFSRAKERACQKFCSVEKIVVEVKMAKCECGGLEITCSDCGGNGKIIFNSDSGIEYCVDCDMCQAAGKVCCKHCGGNGIVYLKTKVGNSFFDSKLLIDIAKLPNCQLVIPETNFLAVYFTFDGGDGVVMPHRA